MQHLRPLKSVLSVCAAEVHTKSNNSRTSVCSTMYWSIQNNIDNSNLNRLVGGTYQDVRANSPEKRISRSEPQTRVIPRANVEANFKQMAERSVIFARSLRYFRLRGFNRRTRANRAILQAFSNLLHRHRNGCSGICKFLTGLSVKIVMSSPGWCCLRCMALVNDDNLKARSSTLWCRRAEALGGLA